MGIYRENRHQANSGERQNSQPNSLQPYVHSPSSFIDQNEYTALSDQMKPS